jgi:hypothetical protein
MELLDLKDFQLDGHLGASLVLQEDFEKDMG